MTLPVPSQVDTKANETPVVDANKQDTKLTPEVMAEEMRQARAEAAHYRTERNDLAKQIADLSKKAEKGSELEKNLAEINGKFANLEIQSKFYDKAHAVGVSDLKLAYLAAKEAGLVNDKGDCDFVKLKAAHPALFAAAPKGNAGDGTGTDGKPFSMNELIRQKAGRL